MTTKLSFSLLQIYIDLKYQNLTLKKLYFEMSINLEANFKKVISIIIIFGLD